jgi:fimbrial chaperone protein
MTNWFGLGLTAAITMVIQAAPAEASAVVIWPVDPTIKAAEQSTSLWLENKGDTAVTMQVRAFGWAQPAGDDRLDPQDAVVASPPIARVEPGSRQLVRIIRRAPGAAPESAYRLIVDELPPPPPEGAQAPQARLAVQMRYSVPLFTYPADPPTVARLTAAFRTGASGRELVLTNPGTIHARLTDLRLVTGRQEKVIHAGLAGYVLPGATIVVPLPAGGSVVRVAVNGTDQELIPSA